MIIYIIFSIVTLLFISWLIAYYYSKDETKYKLECTGIGTAIYTLILLLSYINLIYCPLYKKN